MFYSYPYCIIYDEEEDGYRAACAALTQRSRCARQSIMGAMWGITVHLRAADRPCLASPGLLQLLQRCQSLSFKPRRGGGHQLQSSVVAMVRRAALGILAALDYDQVAAAAALSSESC